MTSWMRNHLTKLYNAVSAPVTETRDALAERLQSVSETFLYCITAWWRIWDMNRRN